MHTMHIEAKHPVAYTMKTLNRQISTRIIAQLPSDKQKALIIIAKVKCFWYRRISSFGLRCQRNDEDGCGATQSKRTTWTECVVRKYARRETNFRCTRRDTCRFVFERVRTRAVKSVTNFRRGKYWSNYVGRVSSAALSCAPTRVPTRKCNKRSTRETSSTENAICCDVHCIDNCRS